MSYVNVGSFTDMLKKKATDLAKKAEKKATEWAEKNPETMKKIKKAAQGVMGSSSTSLENKEWRF